MKVLITLVCLSTLTLLMSANGLKNDKYVLSEMNTMMQKIHYMEATNGGECFFVKKDIICPVEKDANASIEEYNRSVNWLLKFKETHIIKDFREIGLEGTVKFKEL